MPNPGSDAAIDAGCICARVDNGYGRGCGWVDEDGGPQFWITEGCPLHDPRDTKEQKDED